ncbi:putative histone deacetylase 8-like isoform X2 [Penaeus vannamei]|uniref:Putative histone deacetylase 8-like isoform X2 n=1 Tax=Penaeus vannamei TaxID=6689 RepID=A0A423SQG3_PENVA|nr:putative histone deacetylase 8-like isoform X2 [Penaeus vannamei]
MNFSKSPSSVNDLAPSLSFALSTSSSPSSPFPSSSFPSPPSLFPGSSSSPASLTLSSSVSLVSKPAPESAPPVAQAPSPQRASRLRSQEGWAGGREGREGRGEGARPPSSSPGLPRGRSRAPPSSYGRQGMCGADAISGDPIGGGNLTPEAFRSCIKHIRNLNKPTLFLGGGGYNKVNAAKLWTVITSAIVDKPLSADIPEHRFFPLYGPSFELEVSVGLRKSENSQKSLDETINTARENIGRLAVLLGKKT